MAKKLFRRLEYKEVTYDAGTIIMSLQNPLVFRKAEFIVAACADYVSILASVGGG